jgi:ATP synthase protein I
MPEFTYMYNRQRKWTFYLLSIYVLGWGFTSYKTIFLGLILGTGFSYFTLWHMFFRIKRFDTAVAKGKKPNSFGSISRLATAGIAAAIALKFPQYFNIFFVTLGLMTSYVVIMIDYLFQSFQVHK